MVEDGKLSAEEAAKLISAVGAGDGSGPSAVVKAKPGMRFLKIRVFESDRTKPKVNISIPMGLVKVVSKFIPKSARMELNEKNINLEEILASIDEVSEGKILEVHDEEDNEHVEIVIE